MRLVVLYLYPAGMNIYGDRGNVIALARRAEWRGIAVEVREAGVGEPADFAAADIAFIGGGQDREQVAVSRDLQTAKGRDLVRAVEEGLVVLSICGGYQLLGHYFRTGEGTTLPGIGVFDAYTVAGNRRFIGDVLAETEVMGDRRTLAGFENHSGRTYLGPGCRALGRVLVGCGNNGEDGGEGAVSRNAFGCYLHGSLLPKNPAFADHLLRLALARRTGQPVTLELLADDEERAAHEAVVARIRQRGRLRSGAI
ncbi:MAG: glutamine amidotransferase [Chloroflexi bacterium]|nr:glutamine amidotransferase [Chloroflexota bacterium]